MTMNKAEFGDGDRNTGVRMSDGRSVRLTRMFDAQARIPGRPSRRALNPLHIRVVDSLSRILSSLPPPSFWTTLAAKAGRLATEGSMASRGGGRRWSGAPGIGVAVSGSRTRTTGHSAAAAAEMAPMMRCTASARDRAPGAAGCRGGGGLRWADCERRGRDPAGEGGEQPGEGPGREGREPGERQEQDPH